jgi:hypothetical protein
LPVDSDFYPDLELTSTICADLSAFLAHRLAQRNAQLHPSDLNLKLELLASMMYPRSERCVAAMDQLAACEAAEPSADAAQIWARAVRDAVDLMVLGSVESVNSSNARALLLRLTLLPTTLPYDLSGDHPSASDQLGLARFICPKPKSFFGTSRPRIMTVASSTPERLLIVLMM